MATKITTIDVRTCDTCKDGQQQGPTLRCDGCGGDCCYEHSASVDMVIGFKQQIRRGLALCDTCRSKVPGLAA